MALVSICDHCEGDCLVDSLVFIDRLNMNMCPSCINELIENLWANITVEKEAIFLELYS